MKKFRACDGEVIHCSREVGWVKRSVTHRVNESVNEPMGYGAMRLHPSYQAEYLEMNPRKKIKRSPSVSAIRRIL